LRDAARRQAAVEGEIAGEVRGHQAQAVGRELQHEGELVIPARVPTEDGGVGQRLDRALDAVGELHLRRAQAHPGKGEAADEPVQAQGEE